MHTKTFTRALGALTGNQAVQMVRGGLEAIYLSGWQVAADANLAGQTYPDQSLYPANSVPAVVRRINNALLRADQIDHSTGKTGTDYLVPIVADAEAGFGGPLNAFELMKSMIASGAAGVHWEDQLASEKKCGHMGGKVLVPTAQHVRTLNAARLAADISGVPTLVVARTDALAADLMTSDIDPIDQPFLTGERTAEGFYRVRSGLEPVLARAKAYAPYCRPDLGRDRHPGPRPGPRVRHRAAQGIPRKDAGLQLLSVVQLASQALPTTRSPTFQDELGELGYKFQFITLAGFHALNHSMFHLAQGYAKTGMTRLRRAAGGRVRRRDRRLHRGQAPGRGRHRVLRQGRHRPQPGQRHPRAEGLHRRRAVPLNRRILAGWPDLTGPAAGTRPTLDHQQFRRTGGTSCSTRRSAPGSRAPCTPGSRRS